MSKDKKYTVLKCLGILGIGGLIIFLGLQLMFVPTEASATKPVAGVASEENLSGVVLEEKHRQETVDLVASAPKRAQYSMHAEVTAYLAIDEVEGRYSGVTATGTTAVPYRTAAVDPRKIPLGSRIYIPSLDTWFIAEDTGNMVTNNVIDICLPTRTEAFSFGRRNMEVIIQEPLKGERL